jgi:hypothetical protein
MTQMLARTHFHSSKLIRCLVDLAVVDTVDPENAFAEKLGEWIHFADAITLSAVHNDGAASLSKQQSKSQQDEQGTVRVAAEFDRVQTLLINSVMKSCSPKASKTHIKLPVLEFELPINIAAAYVPYRRFYEDHQRDMEMSIEPLRVNVREAVAKVSPRLKKLAELDASFEKILRDRESKLLAKVPVLLRKRFEQLFKQHQQKRAELADVQQADNPVDWMKAGGWLARFCSDMQMLLLAEVELRLQPAMGLIEALNEETGQETQ